MSLRISSILAAAALASCGGNGVTFVQADDRPIIDCALAGSNDFLPQCRIEKDAGADRLIILHPDGGFRRMKRAPDVGGLSVADGAEPAGITRAEGGHIEVRVGSDQYRFPPALLDQP